MIDLRLQINSLMVLVPLWVPFTGGEVLQSTLGQIRNQGSSH